LESFSWLFSFSEPSLDFCFLAFAGFAAESSFFAALAPLAAFGVDDVLSLIFGFLTESERWGV
jgi:hypothetical protein